MLDIKNVAVLGTGVMGSQIAAHCQLIVQMQV